MKRLLNFPTAIQHVVVIVMENRTVDNLFAGYYSQAWTGPGGYQTWGQALNLYNPSASPGPTLTPKSLSAHFTPNHSHQHAWNVESLGEWNSETIGCNSPPCHQTAYSYVPTSDTPIYKFLVQNWAFANNVLQANEGPSFVAHQYLIAGQSGGIFGSLSSPNAEAENPGDPPTEEPNTDYVGNDAEDLGTSGCNPSGYHVKSVNMSSSAPTPTPSPSPTPKLDNGGTISPCEEYPSNILDELVATSGRPPIADWQYIAHSDHSIWAAPLGVQHLWNAYNNDSNKDVEPFAVDPDAFNFALNVSGSTNPTPSPGRPVAELTYVTPCEHESDHPELSGNDNGPQWLGWLINTIGESQYWNSTAIIVTWDDWGGWFDHLPTPIPWGFRPPNNKYNNPIDPNEWGFRVPLIIISPYVQARGYISGPAQSFSWRSQSVILQYIEATFGLSSLNTDDYQNNQADYLNDVFNFAQSPLPYVPIPNVTFSPGPVGSCPNDAPMWRRTKHHRHKSTLELRSVPSVH